MKLPSDLSAYFLLLLMIIPGCRVTTRAPASSTARADTPDSPQASSILRGVVSDDQGRPVPDVNVVLYGGFATRWRVAEALTDARGEFEFNPMVHGSLIQDEASKRWDYYVGIQIEHPELTSADGRSWWDLMVPSIPGQVTRFDVRLVRGGTVEGIVRDEATGLPVKAALRLYLHSPGDFHRYSTTDEQGRFTETGLFPGHYVADFNAPRERYPVIGEFEIRAGKITRVEWSVPVPKEPDDGSSGR